MATCITRPETVRSHTGQNDESQFVGHLRKGFSSELTKTILDIPQMQKMCDYKLTLAAFGLLGHENGGVRRGGQVGGQNTDTPAELLRLSVQKGGRKKVTDQWET